MPNRSISALLIGAAFVLSGCAQHVSAPQQSSNSLPLPVVESHRPATSQQLTLEQIMANPKWIGFAPNASHWRLDGQAVYYDQKVNGQTYPQRVEVTLDGQQRIIPIAERHLTDHENGVINPQNTLKAYVHRGNLFVASLPSGSVTQLTQNSEHVKKPRFLTDGRIAYRQGNQYFAIDPVKGLSHQLVDFRFEKTPQAPASPQGYLEQEQAELIQWIASNQTKAIRAYKADENWKRSDPSATKAPVYLGEDHELVDSALSPSGRWLVVAYQNKQIPKSDDNIMPNYITANGTIEARDVRVRVADDVPAALKMLLIDTQQGSQHIVDLDALPGMKDDVFKSVRDANKKAYGKQYQAPEAQPRSLQLMANWGDGSPSLQWHPTRDQLAIMVEANDNKDRWIATVDTQANIRSQHRLHDDAWVNYSFNNFGWVGDSIYYLSEQSGYSALYLKTPNGAETTLVSGAFEVQFPKVSSNQEHIYFKANKKSPGIYEIYRVAIESGRIEAMTDLNGMTDFILSPADDSLALTHSKMDQPPELFFSQLAPTQEPQQLTHITSDTFKSMEWQVPETIAIETPHSTLPVYAKVFYPTDYDATRAEQYPAVMFVHGAGYLQNVHAGWSGYFREYMFHNFLTEHGYVVMDIDYRASAGYGRDWRTAIYRNMGYPEVEDMAAGVQWMATNANVAQDKVGVYGGSYGGFLTFMALFNEPDLFAAGAALRPVTDWAHYNAPYTSNILNTPDLDPQAYRVSSPIYHAEGLSKPLLINAPMLDDNVFFQDVVRLVQRLIELEKDNFETAIFPVEPHGFKEPSSWLDEYKRIFKLFEQHLK
ncbi:S9 family peptidase [Echinimonas agarilytica]|uniref:Prolyl oligopeptidase family serine peptidase n=1 Tax=Echinimonas agarilytica TaxID=1215918 RepID=A0AA41WAR3_9GAMM|nr:prolyl oligopeptidase family serine peptidase [Echinimonas agarilytica]MCM2681377.1 prolyl oligopeptidase family serine peptidase [Echinimonas agarilytica]